MVAVRVDETAHPGIETNEVRLPARQWAAREPARPDLSASHAGLGRELFGVFRGNVTSAEEGATALGL